MCAALQRDLVALAIVVFVFSLLFWIGWTQAVCSRAIDQADRSSCPEKHTTHSQRPVLHLSTQVDWKKMETANCTRSPKIAKGLVVERHWPLQCHTFPCPGQRIMRQRQDERQHFRRHPLVFDVETSMPGLGSSRFSSSHVLHHASWPWRLQGVLQRSATPKSKTPRCRTVSCVFYPHFMSSFLQVHLWQGAGHADSRGALCFGVLTDSHMLFIFKSLNRELFTGQKGNYI